MNEAKIRLSAKEVELVLNADWILTKNDILKKVKQLLEIVLEEQQGMIRSIHHLPPEIFLPNAKISKGENYKGLPYLVLDHPRYFDKKNVFAIRTLFWWGNFFSVTLHLSGSYKKLYEEKIVCSLQRLQERNIYCCVHEEQWEHHFDNNNYLNANAISEADLRKIIAERSFIKLAKKISLEEWENAPAKLLSDFGLLIDLTGN